MKRFSFFLGFLCLVLIQRSVFAADDGTKVVVIYNTRVAESKGIAEHYAAKRNVPASQVLGFDLPDGDEISRTDFRVQLQKPLLKTLEDRGLWLLEFRIIPASNSVPAHVERKVVKAKIRYLALCYGVPLRISGDSNLREDGLEKLPEAARNNGAAVDSELACLPILEHMMLAGPHVNPLYSCTNADLIDPTNDVLMVARLDGPTPEIARALVDKAMEAETNGLWGRAYFDARGLGTNDQYRLGDEWILGAADLCTKLGWETVIDKHFGSFPPDFPLSHVALYAGWYDENVSGPFARPTVEFMPGAFAYHLHSFSAATLRTTKRQWVGPLLARGATATMGCVDEPFLSGTPNIAIFFARFLYSHFSFAEAAYASEGFLSWQVTVVGDPLYRPYARNPLELQEDLERRHSKLLEWSVLRAVDLNLQSGAPIEKVVDALENSEIAKHSAVLQEKLADLYLRQGKPSSSVFALQTALVCNPSPEQRMRMMLALAHQLPPLGKDAEAYTVYQNFLTQFPDYPSQLNIYRSLRDLAEKLGKSNDVKRYDELITLMTTPHSPPTPPKRGGL